MLGSGGVTRCGIFSYLGAMMGCLVWIYGGGRGDGV